MFAEGCIPAAVRRYMSCLYSTTGKAHVWWWPQVRHMVAALLVVGAGHMKAQDISHKLELGSAHPPGSSTPVSHI